jgi:hypothetical protein
MQVPIAELWLASFEKRLRMQKHRTLVVSSDEKIGMPSGTLRYTRHRGFLQMRAIEYKSEDTKLYPTQIGTQELQLRKGSGAEEVHIETMGIDHSSFKIREETGLYLAKCLLEKDWNSDRAVLFALDKQ